MRIDSEDYCLFSFIISPLMCERNVSIRNTSSILNLLLRGTIMLSKTTGSPEYRLKLILGKSVVIGLLLEWLGSEALFYNYDEHLDFIQD